MARLICFWVSCLISISLQSTIGNACQSDGDCGNKEQCAKEYHQGYCIAYDCSVKNPCDGDAKCFRLEPDNFTMCLKTCSQKSDCRSGYRCYKEGVCLP